MPQNNGACADGKPKEIQRVWILAGKVASSAKKINFYKENEKEPPAELKEELRQGEKMLDELMARLLGDEENLKAALSLERPGAEDEDEEQKREIEFSYQKAVCYKHHHRQTHGGSGQSIQSLLADAAPKGDEGESNEAAAHQEKQGLENEQEKAPKIQENQDLMPLMEPSGQERKGAKSSSRLYFLPILCFRDKNGALKNAPKVNDNSRRAMESFIGDFANRHFREKTQERFEVTAGRNLLEDALIMEAEEKKIPVLHEEILRERALDSSQLFQFSAQMAEALFAREEGSVEGWTICAWPFALEHPAEEALAGAEFRLDRETEEAFNEEFDEIFDSESLLDRSIPVDPNHIADEGAFLLWVKHMEDAMEEVLTWLEEEEGSAQAEMTFVWDRKGERLEAVKADFRCFARDGSGTVEVARHKQISRDVLRGEDAQSAAALMMSMPHLKHPDVKTSFSHQFGKETDNR